MPNQVPPNVEESLDLIHSESFTTMEARAKRLVFGERIDAPTWAILERIPTVRSVHGQASTAKLVEVISADCEVGERQGHRYLRKAVAAGYVLPCASNKKSSVTDNRRNSALRISEKMARLNRYRLDIAKAVEAQIADPTNVIAGSNFVPEEIYMHPVTAVLEARKRIEKEQKPLKVRHIRPKRSGDGPWAAAAIVGAMLLLGTVFFQTVSPTSISKHVEVADKVDGWKKVST